MIVNLLSVDPGANSAWALWSREGGSWRLARWAQERDPSAVRCLELIRELLPSPEAISSGALVVEGQYHEPRARAERHGRAPSPWHDVAALVERRCRWQHAAELAGLAVVDVTSPGLWIPALTRGAPGGDTKARLAWVVEHRLPGLGLRRDEVDAVALGLWWQRARGGA